MENKNPKPKEEIDIAYFFKPVTDLAKKSGTSFKKYIRILWLNKFLFSAIVIVITLAGYSFRYFLPQTYKTQGIFISHTLPAGYCSIMLGNLSQLLSGSNLPIAAKELGVSPEIASEINSIIVSPLKGRLAKEDTTLALFTITLIVQNTDHIDSIQNGIITYLEKSEYARKRKEAKIRSLLLLKTNLEKRLLSLDSLKEIVNSSIIPRSQGEGIILGEPVNPVSVYQAESAWYQDMLRIDEQLAVMNNIEVVQPFLQRNSYNYPDFDKMLRNAFVLSLFIACLLTLIINRKKYSSHLKNTTRTAAHFL